MKISNNPQTIKLISPKPQNPEAKAPNITQDNDKAMAQKPFADIKILNAQVAQIQGLEKALGVSREKHEELLLALQKEKSPELEKKIHNLELKITEMLKKSIAQSQEFEALPSLYRSLLQNYKTKDYDKIEVLLNQTQNKLHYLLEKFENEISDYIPQNSIDFDKTKLKGNLFAQAHNASKISLECLL